MRDEKPITHFFYSLKKEPPVDTGRVVIASKTMHMRKIVP